MTAMSDFVTIPVEMTRKQRDWLKDLGDDLRGSFRDAFSCVVDQHIEAHEKDPLNPARYMMRWMFEHNLQRCDWRDMFALVEEFLVLLEKAGHEDKVRDLHHKLRELRERKF